MRPASRPDRGPRMQVLRCLRPDRATVAMTRHVAATLGAGFVQPPVLEYADVLRHSDERTPIVFVLSPGADPAFDIFKLGAPPARARSWRVQSGHCWQGHTSAFFDWPC